MSIAATRRDRYRRIAHRARRLPGQHGLRPYRVYITTRVEAGTYTGDNPGATTDVELVEADNQPPKLRLIDDEAIALGGLSRGTVEVGPVTPNFTGGGTSIIVFDGSSLSTGDVLYLKTVGPEGTTYYRIVDRKTDAALRWMIRAEPVSTSA